MPIAVPPARSASRVREVSSIAMDDYDDRGRVDVRRPRRSVAGILAICSDGWAPQVHLGYTTPAIIQSVARRSHRIGGIIGSSRRIIYLTKSDDDFVQTYQVGQTAVVRPHAAADSARRRRLRPGRGSTGAGPKSAMTADRVDTTARAVDDRRALDGHGSPCEQYHAMIERHPDRGRPVRTARRLDRRQDAARTRPHACAVMPLERLLPTSLPAGLDRPRSSRRSRSATASPSRTSPSSRAGRATTTTATPARRTSACVIEVADTSCSRTGVDKLRLYAAGRIPVYWIVNLADRRDRGVHRPAAARARLPHRAATTASTTRCRSCSTAATVGSIPVRELTPDDLPRQRRHQFPQARGASTRRSTASPGTTWPTPAGPGTRWPWPPSAPSTTAGTGSTSFFHGEAPERFVFTLNCTDALNMAFKGVLDRRRPRHHDRPGAQQRQPAAAWRWSWPGASP